MSSTTIGPQAPLDSPFDKDLDKHLDAIWEQREAEHQKLRIIADRPPVTRLWDGNFHGGIVINQELEQSWPEAMNDVTTGTLVMHPKHGAAQWVLSHWDRDAQNIFVTVDHGEWRWSGILADYEIEINDKGEETLTLIFLHDMIMLRDLLVWPNPFMPAAGPQYPKVWPWIGPSVYGLKATLFINNARLSANLWQLPDNPLDPLSWAEGLMPWTWQIQVKPGSALLDGSEWAAFDGRMDSFLDMAQPIMQDCQLMFEMRRWLDGDPLPWPGAVVSHGQLIVDIVDKSGVWDQTSTGGTVAGGLLRTATSHADNLVDEVVNVVENPIEPAEYSVSRWFGTHPAQPWVVYRDGEHTGIRASKFKHQMQGPVQMTAGGKSAPGVNEAQSLAIQLTGNVIGSIFRLDTLGTIVDTAVRPHYEDVWLAFKSFKSPLRTMRQGRFYRQEQFVTGADQSYTLSSVLAFRRGFFDTRAVTTFQLEVGNGAPFFIGRHFGLGDRIGATNRFQPAGRVFVEQVHRIELIVKKGAVDYKVTVGDPRPMESPWDRGLRKINRFTGLLRRLSVI